MNQFGEIEYIDMKKIIELIQKTLFYKISEKVIAWFHADAIVVLTTSLFFATSVVIPNNKLFFVLSALYVSFIFFLKKRFDLTVLYCFIPLMLYGIGQEYAFNIIPAYVLKHPLYNEGRNLYFTFSPHTVLSLSACIWLGINLITNNKERIFSWLEVLFITLFGLQIISATRTHFLPIFSTLEVLGSSFVFCYVLIFKRYTQSIEEKQKKIFIVTLIALVTISIVFQSALAVGQYLKRSPLGLQIEVVNELPYFGAGADEDSSQVRPVGLAPHANILAFGILNLWLLSFFLWLSLDTKQKARVLSVLELGFFASTLTITLTQSRSVYIAWLIISLGLLWHNKLINKNLKKNIFMIIRRIKFLIIGIVPPVMYVLTTRLLYTLNSFNPHAGVGTRELLIEEAFEVINRNLVWGVGSAMFIPAAFKQNVTGIMNYFPEAVHNGFLLMIAENGVIFFVFYLLAIWLLLKRVYFGGDTLLKAFATLTILALYTVMLLQPFSAILPLSIIGIFFSLYVTENSKKISLH